MKKILYVTDVFPPRCGGSGWSVYFFARALRQKGNEIQIVSLDGPARVYDNFLVESFPLSRSSIPFVSNWLRENRDLPNIANALKQLSGQFDIAHGHHRFSSIAVALAQPHRFFVTVRDYWPICICGRSIYRTGTVCTMTDFSRCSADENQWKGLAAPLVYNWFDSRLNRWNALTQKAEQIFCISKHLKRQLEPIFNAAKLSVLPNFAEEIGNSNHPDVPDRFILFVGRLERNKGAHLLPEIIKKSKITLPIVIIGDGTLRSELQQIFQSKSIDARFLGYLEYPKMLSVLRRCEFILFPSIWAEPLGRVLIEAAMLSKPSITFSHPGGHHDIVKAGSSGTMADSVEHFAEEVARLSNSPALVEEMGYHARKIYESQFSAEAVIPNLLKFYSK